ncbi:MAG TPA: cyclopropane-fatty-acyl-phospholipid synthase family protein [Thermoleophilaceae bacterium]|nr:cyclopropane-fatty-acyl-phospholipid synthase family protein [Thermoleophilaceae bacterium]
MSLTTTGPLRREIEQALPERPFTVDLWDGSTIASTNGDGGPRFTVNSPRALTHLVRAPGQLGLGRAYVSGDIDVDDLMAVMRVVDSWQPPPIDARARGRLLLAAARAIGVTRPPRVPRSELRPRGKLHSRERDERAVRHHYDVGNEFFELFLDDSMTYSCAIFSRGAQTLEEAQETKRELVCTKLGICEGDRVLDVGCGWGAFAIHAASRHGARVVGITLSAAQAELARKRVADAGLSDRIEIRVMDYRECSGERFDAIASIGMVEHVGENRIDLYARQLAGLLKPGGQLLNHGIARLRHTDPAPGSFNDRYVFPDGETLQLSRVLLALERAGFVTEHVEGFASDYAETLRHWYENLDRDLPAAERIAGEERLRVWRLYLRAARNAFLNGTISVYQARATLAG